jgi:hypothetical protein
MPAGPNHANLKIKDVVLHRAGTMVGTLFDASQRPISDQQVVIRQGDRIIATTVTQQDGRFVVAGLRGGVYQIRAGNHLSTIRAWADQSAPPTALQSAQLISNNQVVRGNLEWEGGGVGWVEATAIALGVAGTTIGIIAWEEAKDGDAS